MEHEQIAKIAWDASYGNSHSNNPITFDAWWENKIIGSIQWQGDIESQQLIDEFLGCETESVPMTDILIIPRQKNFTMDIPIELGTWICRHINGGILFREENPLSLTPMHPQYEKPIYSETQEYRDSVDKWCEKNGTEASAE